MTNCHVTEELHRAEKRLQAAMFTGDVVELDRFLYDRRLRLVPSLARVSKAQDLQACRSRQLVSTKLVEDDLEVVGERTGVTRILTTLEGTDPGVPFAARMLRLSAPTAEVRHVLDRYLRVTQLGRGARNAPPGAMSAATAAGNSPSRRYLTYKPPIGKCHPE